MEPQKEFKRSAAQQELFDKVEKLSQKDESELLARLVVQQSLANKLTEKTRRNTSVLVNIVIIIIILEIISAFFSQVI